MPGRPGQYQCRLGVVGSPHSGRAIAGSEGNERRNNREWTEEESIVAGALAPDRRVGPGNSWHRPLHQPAGTWPGRHEYGSMCDMSRRQAVRRLGVVGATASSCNGWVRGSRPKLRSCTGQATLGVRPRPHPERLGSWSDRPAVAHPLWPGPAQILNAWQMARRHPVSTWATGTGYFRGVSHSRVVVALHELGGNCSDRVTLGAIGSLGGRRRHTARLRRLGERLPVAAVLVY